MPAISLRDDYDAAELRALAKRSRDVRQARRLLALAAVYDGMSRAEAARIGGMDRQMWRLGRGGLRGRKVTLAAAASGSR